VYVEPEYQYTRDKKLILFVFSLTVGVCMCLLCMWYVSMQCLFLRFVVTGPLTHYLYHFLEAISPSGSSVSALRKVVLERLILTPPYLLAFFYTVALLEVIFPPLLVYDVYSLLPHVWLWKL